MLNRLMQAAIAAILILPSGEEADAAPGDFGWNHGWDATGFGAMDEIGATASCGMFFGAINFGGGMQNSGNPFTGDVWVARYSATGAHEWSRTFTPGGMGVTVTAITCAPNGGVYVAGTIINNGMIDFGGGNLAGANQMWIVKFDDLGNFLWSDTFGLGTIRSLDGDQNLLGIGGEFFGPIDFGGGMINPVGNLDAFVALLHGGAAHIWSAGFGDAFEQITKDVDVDVSGSLVATGCFQGTVDFGGGNLVSNAVPDLFVTRFDPAGLHLWSKNFVSNFGPGADIRASIAQDEGVEHVALVGTVLNLPVDFGGGALAPLGGSDIVLAMLDENGIHQWSKRFGSPIDDQGHDAAFDAGNNVVATGAFQMSVDFGGMGGPLNSNGGVDLFVSSWNYLGSHAWNRNYGTVNDDILCRAVTDPLGGVLLFGTADLGINFGGGGLPNAGIYLAKIQALNAPVGAPKFDGTPASGASVFPNPFVESASILFDMPRRDAVDVTLHDVNGRRVRSLAAREMPAGPISLVWDGRDDGGRIVPAGVYFWRVEGPGVGWSGSVARMR